MTTAKKSAAIQGWMGKQARRWLRKQARAHTRIIEVGVWKGRSTRTIAKATQGTVWAVDHWRGAPDDPEQHERLYAEHIAEGSVFAEFRKNLRPWIRSGHVIPWRSDSVEGAATLFHYHGRFADWVFIDADHSYEGCAADIQAYRPLLVEGGLLSGHDYSENWPGVRRAVDEAFGPTVRLGPSSIWSVVL